jgi:hypothetical protein
MPSPDGVGMYRCDDGTYVVAYGSDVPVLRAYRVPVALAMEAVVECMEPLLEEARDMAGWGDTTMGATQQYRVFSAVAKIAQDALDALAEDRTRTEET